MLPLASAVSFPEFSNPVQLKSVTRSDPPVICTPPANVEDAVEDVAVVEDAAMALKSTATNMDTSMLTRSSLRR